MAHKHENEKGFLVIRTELLEEALRLGGIAICDSCNKSNYTGYYIAVLNRWYCDKCYEEWYAGAKRYTEDIPIETRNYNHYSKILLNGTN